MRNLIDVSRKEHEDALIVCDHELMDDYRRNGELQEEGKRINKIQWMISAGLSKHIRGTRGRQITFDERMFCERMEAAEKAIESMFEPEERPS